MAPKIRQAPNSRVSAGRLTTVLLSLLVFLSCLGVTLFAWQFARTEQRKEREVYFDHRVRDAQGRIEQRLRTYEQVLRDTHALFAAGPVTRNSFARFISAMHLSQNYPGIQGVGFSRVIPKAELGQHLKAIQQEGFPAYTVRPAGDRDPYTSIIYLEPFEGRNLRAFGYDMYSEPVRRAAMDLARDLGEVTISGKVTLLQETDKDIQAGFLMYLPVFNLGQPFTKVPTEPAQRRSQIKGWVYAPFRMNDLMAGVFGEQGGDLALKIYDGAEQASPAVMFCSTSEQKFVANRSLLQTDRRMEFGHHQWILRIQALSGFEARMWEGKPRLMLGAGLLMTAMLTLLTGSLAGGRRRALRSAAERGMRYQALMEQANDGVLVMTPEGVIQEANSKATIHFGYGAEELRGMNVTDLYEPEALGEARERMRVVQEQGEARFEARHRRKDGSPLFSEVSTRVVDICGESLNLAFIHDISKRKASEAMLVRSEAKFRVLSEQSQDLIFLFRVFPDRAYEFVSPSSVWITGFGPEEYYADPELGPRSTHPEDLALLRKAFEAPSDCAPFRIRSYRKDGSLQWLELSITKRSGPEGRLEHLQGVARDVSERVKVERALQESETRMRAIFENAAFGIVRSDENGLIREANQAFLRMLGYRLEELIGASFGRLTHPDDVVRDGELRGALVSGESEEVQTEARWIRKDGKTIWVSLIVRPVQDPMGNSRFFLGIVEDITEKRQVQSELNRVLREQQIILETANVGISLVINRRQAWINPWVMEVFQFSKEELEGHSTRMLYTSQEAYESMGRDAYPVLASGETYETVQELVRKDGQHLWIHYNGRAIDPSDLSKGTLWILSDVTAQRQAQDVLKESEARFRSMFESHSAVMLLVDPEQGNLVDANPAAAAFYGYPRALLQTMNVSDINCLTRPELEAAFHSAAEQKLSTFVFRHRTAKGEIRQVEVNSSPTDILGKKLLFSIVVDITDRKIAEEALRASEEKYSALFQILPAGVALTDARGRIIDANPASEHILGLTRSQELERSFDAPDWKIIRPDGTPMPPEEYASVRAMRESRIVEDVEMGVVRPDGAVAWVLVTATPVPVAPYGVAIVFTDITARRNAEVKLVQESARYHSILDIARDGIHLVDEAGRLVECNAAFLESLGRIGEEPMALGVLDWDAQIPQEQIREAVHSLIAKPAAFETRHRRKDGTIFDVEVNAGGIKLNGEAYLLAASRDISGRKRAEREIAIRQAQLEEINQSLEKNIQEAVTELRQKDRMLTQQSRQAAMGEMIGNIAHQWRQPLSALSMLLANLRDRIQVNELSPEVLATTFAKADALIQTMSSTINDFRNFFRPDKTQVAFSALRQIQIALDLVEASFESAGVQVRLEASQDVELFGFPNEFSQAFLNILGNAKQAIRESGTQSGEVQICLEQVGAHGRILVRDNGGGIPEEAIDRIFEPFFTTRESGSGIGLYMSKQIIEGNMNGRLSARNVRDGAEFEVLVPRPKESK